MTPIPTVLTPARTHRTRVFVAAPSVFIAVGTVVLLLVLAGTTRSSHTAIRHPAPTYYPLIQYRGTGAPPATTTGPRRITPTLVNPRKSYGAVP